MPRTRVLVFLLSLLGLVAVPASASAQATGFYQPPSPLPAGRAGDIIRSEEVAPGPLAPIARGFRVLYRSTSATGQPRAVSGIVLVPRQPSAGPRRVVGWAPGTHGMADRCASSVQIPAGVDYEQPMLGQTLRQGWVVAVTDYEGLGTPGEHAYSVGRALGRNQLDVIRAARRLPAAGVGATGPNAVMGYSEGGGSTAWAAEDEVDYAPELDLRGAAVGGIVGDPLVVGRSLDGGPFAAFLFDAAIGFDTSYPELDLERYLTPAGRVGVTGLKNGCVGENIALAAGQRSSTNTTEDLLARADWRARLRENTVGIDGQPRTATQIAHARLDNVLPYAQAVAANQRWCARGANTRLVDAAGVDHLSAMGDATSKGIAFLSARFAGTRITRPAACGGASGDPATARLRIGFPGKPSAKRPGQREIPVSLRASRRVTRVTFTLRKIGGRHLGTARIASLPGDRSRRFRLRIRARGGMPRGLVRAQVRYDQGGVRSATVRKVRVASGLSVR